jgi:glucosyl-dolichyl phosphate glucuronosyltransferase
MPKKPFLSVVITSHTNERIKDIFELLESIRAQTFSDYEIIYVVERSPSLFASLEEYSKVNNSLALGVVYNSGPGGLSESRNMGTKNSSGQVIAFIDDDVLLSKTWAEELVKTFESSNSVIGVTGPAIPLWDDEAMNWLPEELHWVISCTSWFTKKGVWPIRNAWGHNMAFKSEVFNLCLLPTECGYHRGTMAEDLGFSLNVKAKTGKTILYNSEVQVFHRVHAYRLNLRFLVERSRWIGHSRRSLRESDNVIDDERFTMEYSLLKSMFTSLPVKIAKAISKKPSKFMTIISTTVIILASTLLGYISDG